jgi:GH35 family endo-1,4-beta-xylanase
MKKLFGRVMYFIIVLFFVAVGTLKAQSSVVSWNFESNSIGDSLGHIGWSSSDAQAVVANDPVAGGNKVLKNIIHNYNAAPFLRYILPVGKTLADFNSFTFKGYFAQGDVGYKDIIVEAYQTMPTAQFNNNASAKIGSWNRAQMGSTGWENIGVNITNSSSLYDTIYVAFGISCAGTGDVGATGDTTIWYADNVTLVPKAVTSYLSWNFESNSIGASFAHIGWSPSDVQAVVANDPVAGGNKVLKNTIHNYNAAPVLQYILPAGKTLADFNSFTFKGYFAQGDVGYKDIVVEAYQTMPTAQFSNNASAKIGDWNRAQMGSTGWENIAVSITNSSSLHDTIYVAFGISCAGTGDVGATGDTTIWYADSVTLVAKPLTSYLSWNFESNSIGDSLDHMGWSSSDAQAVVANDPVAGGNNVLKNIIHNYNAAPFLRYILPVGKTLADFDTVTFKGYFAQGDVAYKDIIVEAYQTKPTGPFANAAGAKVGDWNRAQGGSTGWENIGVNITNSSSLHDTIYVAFGISCAGTGDVGATGDTTIWYADNVTLVPKPAASLNSIFAISKNSIDFGSDTVGNAKKDSVKIYSRGTDTLRVTSISSTNALFTFSPSVFTIAPSDSSKLTITFTPVDTSSQSGFIILTNNAAGSPDSISVKGKGLGKAIPIVTNGGFENSNTGVVDTTAVKGWLIQTATTVTPAPVFQIVSDTVQEGTRALKVTINAAGTNQWDIQAVADSVRVKPGGIYNYSVWARAAKAGAQVNFTMGNYAYTEYKVIRPATLTTQWQQFTMQFTVNDNQVVIRGPIHFSYAGNVGNTIYIDNLQIAENKPSTDSGTVYTGPAIAAGMSKFIGNTYDSPDPKFINYWTQVTPGNAGKFGSVATSADSSTWNWSTLDSSYNYAKNHNLIFKDHNLIWGQQQPAWITAAGFDTAHQRTAVEQWIRMVGHRYPAMDMIDVVNEPLPGHAPAPYAAALGGSGTTGWDWVIWAFQKARQYMPAKTKLLINEYNILNSTSNTNAYLQIINLLKTRGLVDGIGIQAHRFELEATDTALIRTNLNTLTATGLPIYISEFDLGNIGDSGVPNDSTQLALYKKYFPVLWKHPGIKGFTLWGYQSPTWQTTAYLVRSDETARPALLWLAQYVKANPMDVKEIALQTPSSYELKQNFPNPFNPTTNIQYNIPKTSTVTLKVYDILGRLVQTLVNSEQKPGNYSVTFNAQNFSSGVYFYQLQAGSFTETKKLLLVK